MNVLGALENAHLRLLLIAVVVVCDGCGGSPSGPSRAETSIPRFTITGSIKETQSGAPVAGATVIFDGVSPVQTDASGAFAIDSASGPTSTVVVVTAPGYLTRNARVTNRAVPAEIDIIKDGGDFSLDFYRHLARDGFDRPDSLDVLRPLSESPRMYLQTTGLQQRTVTAMQQAAGIAIPSLTGGRLQLAGWETGETTRPPSNGWIVVDLVNQPDDSCGRASVGAPAGHIWMNTAPKCARNGDIIGTANLFAHEIGHALGLFHVNVPGSLMLSIVASSVPVSATAAERYHAAIIYRRALGNRDVDVDPPPGFALIAPAPIVRN